MAASVPEGAAILEFLRSPPVRKLLVAAAAAGDAPVGPLAALIVKRFRPRLLERPVVRQFVGLAVRSILAEAGYSPVRSGVRVPDNPLFSVGTIYAPTATQQPAGDAVLKRFLDTLSRQEIEWTVAYLQGRLLQSSME
jgi:hypothetical protein